MMSQLTQVPQLPTEQGKRVQAYHSTPDTWLHPGWSSNNICIHITRHLRKTDYLKEDKSKLKLCGFQSHLFINISSLCHEQFSCAYVWIKRHREDLTSSSFNKSEFIFTTWYCTRSSAENRFLFNRSITETTEGRQTGTALGRALGA